jgi:hypothetical protein
MPEQHQRTSETVTEPGRKSCNYRPGIFANIRRQIERAVIYPIMTAFFSFRAGLAVRLMDDSRRITFAHKRTRTQSPHITAHQLIVEGSLGLIDSDQHMIAVCCFSVQ